METEKKIDKITIYTSVILFVNWFASLLIGNEFYWLLNLIICGLFALFCLYFLLIHRKGSRLAKVFAGGWLFLTYIFLAISYGGA